MAKKTTGNDTQDIVSLKGPAREWLKSHSDAYQALDAEATKSGSKSDRQARPTFARKVAEEFIKHFKLAPYTLEDGREVNPLEGCTVLKKAATLGNLRSVNHILIAKQV